MELGKAKLRQNGMNCLLNALHPQHGLLWTDGQGIYLTDVHLYRDHVQKAGSLRLGEFTHVQSVHWSCTAEDGSCYMAAVHSGTVTVWLVSGLKPKLAFKQVRKINVQPLPQGCLWNPHSDVLCLLSRQQCSFYFRHTHNRGSFAFPALEHEKISCGCWSQDGKRLVICVGTALLIYAWNDLADEISDFVTTAWRIPNLSGSVASIVPVSNNSLVCTSALPLEALCRNSHVDTFVPPDIKKMEQDSNGILSVKGSPSVKDSLFNLQTNPQKVVHDAATLSLIALQPGLQDPALLASCVVPGVINPDILHFQTETQCIVVGSNAQNILQIFALLDNHLLPADMVTLDKDQRPKGICGLHSSTIGSSCGVLAMLGKAEPKDPTFPSNNNSAPFTLCLSYVQTRPDKAKHLQAVSNGHAAKGKATSSSTLVKSESLRDSRKSNFSDSRLHATRTSYRVDRQDVRVQSPTSPEAVALLNLRLSDDEKSLDGHSKLVEEIKDSPRSLVVEVSSNSGSSLKTENLETETVDFSQSSAQFDNDQLSQRYEIKKGIGGDGGEKSVSGTATPVSQTSSSSASVAVNETVSSSTAHQNLEAAPAHSTTNGHSNGHSNGGTHFEKLPHDGEGKSVRPKSAYSDTDSSLRALDSSFSQHTRDSSTLSSRLSQPLIGPNGRHSGDDSVSVCSSFNSNDSNYDNLEKRISEQREQIEALQKRLKDLTVMVEDTSCVFPTKYQKMTEPEVVSVQCVVGSARVSRKFLLDNGRLQLESVKQAFGLLTVELILEGEPLVLGSNVDGYIPMKFAAGADLQVTGIPVAFSPQVVRKGSKKKDAVVQ